MDRADVEERGKSAAVVRRARAEEVSDGTEAPLTVRGFFKCKGAWPATDGAAAIGCCRKGRSCKLEEGWRRWAGLTSWCPVIHTVLENTDRQTPWRDRWTDEEYLFGDSLCLHLQWLRKQLRAQKKRQQTEGDLTAL